MREAAAGRWRAEVSPEPEQRDAAGKPGEGAGRQTRQYAMAMELPFLIVGGVLAGGLAGWLLDRWLHTAPWLMLALGSLGFIGGLRDVLRRAGADDDKGSGSQEKK